MPDEILHREALSLPVARLATAQKGQMAAPAPSSQFGPAVSTPEAAGNVTGTAVSALPKPLGNHEALRLM